MKKLIMLSVVCLFALTACGKLPLVGDLFSSSPSPSPSPSPKSDSWFSRWFSSSSSPSPSPSPSPKSEK